MNNNLTPPIERATRMEPIIALARVGVITVGRNIGSELHTRWEKSRRKGKRAIVADKEVYSTHDKNCMRFLLREYHFCDHKIQCPMNTKDCEILRLSHNHAGLSKWIRGCWKGKLNVRTHMTTFERGNGKNRLDVSSP